jgi:hypothetical protein
MPVIKGFKYKMELAPILISENLISRLIEGDDNSTVFKAVEYWKEIINSE